MAPFGEAHYDAPPPPRQRSRRPQTDFGSTYVHWMRHRVRAGSRPKGEEERPAASYIVDILPPAARRENPADTIPSKHLHSSLNKIKHPVNLVKWTPEGRRLLTGSSSGEFTLWNGMGFNFETIMQAHDHAIRAASWSYSNDWFLSADHDGVLKYWQPNFNNVKVIQAHDSPVRDLAFSPTDTKFVTASDDATLKVWDFAGGVEESTITGHGWDVKTVDWHPTKGLLVSGSKDHQVKLWDPRTSRCLTTLHGHKNAISKTAFEPLRGHMLATCAKDPVARIFDLRMMRDVLLLRGHERDIATLTWHPIHPQLLSTGGGDGSLFHYILDEPNIPNDTTVSSASPYDAADPASAPAQTIYPAHRIPHAHEYAIWSLDWHPLGHILASGSNDRITRFWARARPGDSEFIADRYHLGDASADPASAHWNRRPGPARAAATAEDNDDEEDDADALVDQKMPARMPGLPGISATGSDFPGLPGLPGMGAAPLPPPPPQGQIPDLAQLTRFFSGAAGNPPLTIGGGSFPPPIDTHNGLPPPPGINSLPGIAAAFNGAPPGLHVQPQQDGGVRKRAPLPSQQDSLMEEMNSRRGSGRR